MKLRKVYDMVVKAHLATQRPSANSKPLGIGTYKGKILVLPTPYQGFIVDPKDWIYDTARLLGDRQQINGERLITNDGAYQRAVLTDELKTHHGGLYVKLSSEKYPEIWVNTKFLDPFDKSLTRYEVAGQMAIVRAYEGDELVGVVCPMVIKEG
jgi:hypothetical protein